MKHTIGDLEWRCRRCSTLLGVRRGDSIHVRHKRVQLVVAGRVMAVCPRCTELNELETGETRSAA